VTGLLVYALLATASNAYLRAARRVAQDRLNAAYDRGFCPSCRYRHPNVCDAHRAWGAEAGFWRLFLGTLCPPVTLCAWASTWLAGRLYDRQAARAARLLADARERAEQEAEIRRIEATL
jgi:hypothetical protein